MKELFQSLSVSSGAIVIAICAAALAWSISRVRPVALRWLIALVIPFVLACTLFWSPIWIDSKGASEYAAWQYLFIGVWFVTGALASVAVLIVLRGRSAPETKDEKRTNEIRSVK